jgi:hypothetical protein
VLFTDWLAGTPDQIMRFSVAPGDLETLGRLEDALCSHLGGGTCIPPCKVAVGPRVGARRHVIAFYTETSKQCVALANARVERLDDDDDENRGVGQTVFMKESLLDVCGTETTLVANRHTRIRVRGLARTGEEATFKFKTATMIGDVSRGIDYLDGRIQCASLADKTEL